MAGLKGTAARQMAQDLASRPELGGVSWKTIYRRTTHLRSRKTRSDAGSSEVEQKLPEETLRRMCAMTAQLDMAAWQVIEYAEENGWIDRGVVTPSSYNRLLVKYDITRAENRKNRQAHRRWQAAKPNDLHQLDFTVSEQFYIDDDGTIKWESPMHRNKNRRGNRKPRLWLYQLVDDHSRVKFAMFFSGLNTLYALEFLRHAWSPKADPKTFPFHGLPKILYSDQDSVLKSGKFLEAMQKLGVEPKRHKPGEAQAKGKVEVGFRMLKEYQKITRLKSHKLMTVDHANKFLYDKLIGYNWRVHSTTAEIPFQRWMRVADTDLRAAPAEELYDLLFYDKFTVHVSKDLTFTIKGVPFQLRFVQPFLEMADRKVEVFWHPREARKIVIPWKGADYEVETSDPQVQVAGEYKTVAKTPAQELRAELDEVDLDSAIVRTHGWNQEKYSGIQFVERDGEKFDETRITQKPRTRQYSRMEALEQVIKRIDRKLAPDESQRLMTFFNDWVTEDLIAQAVDMIEPVSVPTQKAARMGVA